MKLQPVPEVAKVHDEGPNLALEAPNLAMEAPNFAMEAPNFAM